MKSVKVFYLSDINPEILVFHSQVLGMVQGWSRVGQAALLYHTRKHCDYSGADFTVVESKGWPSLIRLLWRLELIKNNWRKRLDGADIIHCRDAVTAWMAMKAIPRRKRNHFKVIFDCRGAFVEELSYLPSKFPYSWLKVIREFEYRAMERWVMSRADLVLAVSERLSHYLLEQYGRKADLIIHSIISGERFRFSAEQREKIRRRFGWKKERVFIYVGSSAGWQRLDILGQWWRSFLQNHPNDQLLALTDDPGEFLKAAGLMENIHRYNITIDSVPHAEIPGFLSAADYGIIFRDESLVNQVSSPVKLSEYLAAGLLVITNQKYFTEINPHRVFVVDPNANVALPNFHFNENERALQSEYWSEQLSGKNAVKRMMEHLFPQV